MSTKSFARKDAERLLPLLRSIGGEIRERGRAIDGLEERLSTLSDERYRYRGEIARIEAELACHRRELRRVERELGELGCNLDADHPLRILIPGHGERFAWEGRLDRTKFYRQAIDTHA
jgi:hypothetical protein